MANVLSQDEIEQLLTAINKLPTIPKKKERNVDLSIAYILANNIGRTEAQKQKLRAQVGPMVKEHD